MSAARGHWSSKLGFVLAASGSAIGLGNLWKFPYITWDNEGGAFVIVYLVCIALIGLPIMMAEILLGRRSQKSAVGAVAEAGPGFAWVGGLCVFTGYVILGYYTVIAGWSLRYFWSCLRWSLSGFDPNGANSDAFGRFAGNGWLQIALSAAFMAVTVFVVSRGIRGGIERVTKILMPILFVILVLLLGTALSLEKAGEALGFIFKPDFSTLGADSVLEALGHSFFTLSLGMGAMITYGSYLNRRDSVVSSAAVVVGLDTLIALVATVVMFSVIFSFDMADSVSGSTVGMLFITLPALFYTEVPLGVLLAPLFFVLVSFAALTSTISILEVTAAYFIDQRGWSRLRAVVFCGAGSFALSLLCALSFGASSGLSGVEVFEGKGGVFANLDHLAANWLLPLGGLFITLVAGWVLRRADSERELCDGAPGWFHYGLWRFAIRFIAPVAVAWIIVNVILGKDFS